MSRESGTVVAPSAERRRKRPMGIGIDGPNRDKSVFFIRFPLTTIGTCAAMSGI
jgi:hypothetical protein